MNFNMNPAVHVGFPINFTGGGNSPRLTARFTLISDFSMIRANAASVTNVPGFISPNACMIPFDDACIAAHSLSRCRIHDC